MYVYFYNVYTFLFVLLNEYILTRNNLTNLVSVACGVNIPMSVDPLTLSSDCYKIDKIRI